MERLCNHVYIVVGNGISDIGKGWITASILGLNPNNTLPVKIDPLLNTSFPQHLGVEIQNLCSPEDVEESQRCKGLAGKTYKISEDCLTYATAGGKIYPDSNIVAGELINRFLCTPDTEIRPGEIKKRTFNDLSYFLAQQLTEFVRKHRPDNLIIEVGGTLEDAESIYIPGAMRFLGEQKCLGVTPEIVLLTFFDYAEAFPDRCYKIKTQFIRHGIRKVANIYYQLPMRACLARRRRIPNHIGDEVLHKDLLNVAYETQTPPEKMVLIPNVDRPTLRENLEELTLVLRSSGLFS